ncbi:MAG: SDR family oxidoreductase [Phycisphaerales bacterium]|nr:SDR family oxidoreductase [Phycisphaerales bacterium]
MSNQPVAIVTAASKGIGAACARRLAEDGFRVALMSRSPAIKDIADELGGLAIEGDMMKADDIERFIAATVDHYGRLDVAALSAGHLPRGPLLDLTDEDWRNGLDMVLLSVMRIARAAVPAMRACGAEGSIVCISGAAAREVMDDFPISTVLRSGLTALVRMAARQWAPDIRVNSVLPGFVDSYDVSSEILATIPVGKVATTRQIADIVAYLCSRASSYVTGESICADGGMTTAIR